jgi:hypothetical protein
LRELGEEIDTTRVCLFVVGEAETLNLLDLTSALAGAVESEEGYRVDTLVQADTLSEKTDGVLPQETVEDGNLANLKTH